MKVRIKPTGLSYRKFCVQEHLWWFLWEDLYFAGTIEECMQYVEELKRIAKDVELVML